MSAFRHGGSTQTPRASLTIRPSPVSYPHAISPIDERRGVVVGAERVDQVAVGFQDAHTLVAKVAAVLQSSLRGPLQKRDLVVDGDVLEGRVDGVEDVAVALPEVLSALLALILVGQ